MKVVFSGCQWNTIVFSMDNNQIEFENWLAQGFERFQELVRSDPAKYKVTNRRGPSFPSFIVTASRDPELYANELRCRLSTTRDANGESVCNAVLLRDGIPFDPKQVRSGGYVTPIFRLGYYKNGDDFGLTLTVLKAEYTAPEVNYIENEEWTMDTDSNTMGSGSSSGDEEATTMTV